MIAKNKADEEKNERRKPLIESRINWFHLKFGGRYK